MNYYECIQKSLDYMECNLENEIVLDEVAKEAVMSFSNYYRMFFSMVGYTVKEYIRLRRLSLAAKELTEDNAKVIDIAIKYGFDSTDSFSRAFKKTTGFLPSEFKKQGKEFDFERIDIMSKYFEVQDKELLEKYPDIKVMKEMEPFYAAACRAYSKTPEHDAFDLLRNWAEKNKLLQVESKYRVYGYDIPDSLGEDGIYGYEVLMTIPEDYEFTDELVTKKKLNGGLYAVTSTTIGGIVSAWERFGKWLELSKYEIGGHQCLEEHDALECFQYRDYAREAEIKVNLYMPISKRMKGELQEETIEPVRVAYYREYGEDSELTAHHVWNVMLTWAREKELDPKKSKIYMHNHGFKKVKKCWHEIMITVDDTITIHDELVKEKIFEGGLYMSCETDLNHLVNTWHELGKRRVYLKKKAATHQWVEQWKLDDWTWPEKGIKVFYPIGESKT